jgi:hypothetical protein
MSESAQPRRLYPQRLQNAFMQVGEPDAEFRPWPGRLLARMLQGLILGAAGVGILVQGFLHLDNIVECLLGGLVLVAIGAVMALKMWTIWGECFLLCPKGLVRRRGLRVLACRWQQIKMITEKEGEQSYQIVVAHGDPWELDADHTREVAVLAAKLRELSHRHHIRWEVKKKEKED